MMTKIQAVIAAAAVVLLAQYGGAFQICPVKTENGLEIVDNVCEGPLVCCKENVSRCCNETVADIPPGAIPVSVHYKHKSLPGSDAKTNDLPGDSSTKDEDSAMFSVPVKKAKLGPKDSVWQKLLDSGTLPLVHELWHDDPKTTPPSDVDQQKP